MEAARAAYDAACADTEDARADYDAACADTEAARAALRAARSAAPATLWPYFVAYDDAAYIVRDAAVSVIHSTSDAARAAAWTSDAADAAAEAARLAVIRRQRDLLLRLIEEAPMGEPTC
jgi:hypothetical protein